MKSSIFKTVIALVIAATAGGGFFVFAQPPEGKTVYIAGQDITKGHTIDTSMIRKMTVHSEANVPAIDIESMIGKKAANNIQEGEWITPAVVTAETDSDKSHYTLTLPAVQAGGPLLEAGTEVNIWENAGDTEQSRKILSNVLVSQVVSNENSSDGNVTVVLALDEADISVVSTAQQRSGVFFTTGNVTRSASR
ncbi:SAF domain-containing protein [Lentibacillus salinarum]|uniref:SAF domain-containing protein n=1 Tax=Lentibacillus salinarum TaxID=446820 RepID=A0ABW3ZWA4_9BACI